MANPIITVATMKGGSGKSTVASCLAVYWHLRGRRPTLIDADPQRSIMRLAARERALGGVAVIEDATEEATQRPRGGSRARAALSSSIRRDFARRRRWNAWRSPISCWCRSSRRRSTSTACWTRSAFLTEPSGWAAPALPLSADPDDARFRHREAHPRRAHRGRDCRCCAARCRTASPIPRLRCGGLRQAS